MPPTLNEMLAAERGPVVNNELADLHDGADADNVLPLPNTMQLVVNARRRELAAGQSAGPVANVGDVVYADDALPLPRMTY